MAESNIAENLLLARAIVEDVRDEEIDSLDNLPENLQYSSRAETMSEIIDLLDEAIEYISDAEENLKEV